MIENLPPKNPLGGAQLTTERPPRIFPSCVLAKAAMSRDADPKADSKTEPKAERLFDKRTLERNIKKGLIGRKDYEKHIKALEDVAGKGVYGGKDGQDSDQASESDSEDAGTGANAASGGSSNSGH
jgi:hypothetical protein